MSIRRARAGLGEGPSLGLRVVVILGLLAAGCATRGRDFNADLVDKIRPGVTTQEDCRRWFGEPISMRRNASGASRWEYSYEESERRGTSSVTKVVRSLGSIFRFPVFFPPVDVAYEKSTSHSLTVLFDDHGRVDDFTYERQVTPGKVVY